MEGATLFRRLGLLTGIDRGPVVLGKKLPGRDGGATEANRIDLPRAAASPT